MDHIIVYLSMLSKTEILNFWGKHFFFKIKMINDCGNEQNLDHFSAPSDFTVVLVLAGNFCLGIFLCRPPAYIMGGDNVCVQGPASDSSYQMRTSLPLHTFIRAAEEALHLLFVILTHPKLGDGDPFFSSYF